MLNKWRFVHYYKGITERISIKMYYYVDLQSQIALPAFQIISTFQISYVVITIIKTCFPFKFCNQ